MALIATENFRLSNTVKNELWPHTGYCRKSVVVNEAAAKTYVIGQTVGLVTASGKYKIAVETAVDGSKVIAGVVMQDVSVPANTDTKVLILVQGPAEVSKAALVFDASYNNATKLGVAYADLEAKGINVLETV